MTERNELLSSLPNEEYEALAPHFKEVELELGARVASFREPNRYMYFPTSGIISLLHYLRDGESGEVGVVGNEGVLGTWLFMSGTRNIEFEAVVQARGRALRLPADEMLKEFQRSKQFQYHLLCYTQALMMQISQTALCNRHHRLEQQFARWLLLSQDMLQGGDIVMTQELIANMLGVRREGVSHSANKLQKQGLIDYSRGRIRIAKRKQLEQMACECYFSIKSAYQDLYATASDERLRKQRD